VTAEIDLPAADGRALAYLGAHAEIFRQQFAGDRAVVRCHLPKHLLPRINGPDVWVRLLDQTPAAVNGRAEAPSYSPPS
jgi:GTP-binding protein HflX